MLTTSFLASRIGSLSRRGRHWPWATTVALLVVGIPTLVQFTVAPWLLENLERNWALIGRGQVWRLLTALVVQDGGIVGTIFNLVALAAIGIAAEQVWGAKRWAVIALAAGLGSQFWGKVVQPVGAGNSVAVFGLAASVAVLAVRQGVGVQRLAGLISLLGAAVLLIIGDIHGGAATIGALVDSRSQAQARTAPSPKSDQQIVRRTDCSWGTGLLGQLDGRLDSVSGRRRRTLPPTVSTNAVPEEPYALSCSALSVTIWTQH